MYTYKRSSFDIEPQLYSYRYQYCTYNTRLLVRSEVCENGEKKKRFPENNGNGQRNRSKWEGVDDVSVSDTFRYLSSQVSQQALR